MNRFIPDTWWEALLRPLAMAAPNGHVYVEIMAPDLRFLAAVLLSVLLLVFRKKLTSSPRAVLVLAGLVALSFVPWLVSSGNGRYFVPMLLLGGPLVVGLAWALPATKAARVGVVLVILGAQIATTANNIILGAWGLTTWRAAPYFQVSVPRDLTEQPATYVTMTSISYSLIAPQFHPESHWVNISAMSGDPRSLETRRARSLFAKSSPLYLVLPTVLRHSTEDGQPIEKLKNAVDAQLASQQLALDHTRACRVVQSAAMARQVLGDDFARRPADAQRAGFWLCPLAYPVQPPPAKPLLPQLDEAFAQLEHRCPGIFPPGSGTSALPDGAMRDYAAADMKVYIMNDGGVYYKYWRSLNPQRIASLPEVLRGTFELDCTKIHGRSGMPWDRSI